MSAPKVTFLQKVRAAWGEDIPPEVHQLAEYADARTATKAAEAIGYSPAVVSHVFANDYAGDLPKVFEKIRGAMMGETVSCEVWGEIGRHQCLAQQDLPFSPTSSARAECYRACRSGCPNSRLKEA